MHRHGIEHLVGHHGTLDARPGETIEPLDAPREARQPLPEQCLLAFTQIGAQLHHKVVFRQRVECLQCRQQVAGQLATAGAELDNNGGVARLQDRSQGVCDGASKERRDLRSRDEIPFPSELASPCRVITQTGFIERHLHVAVESQATVTLRGSLANSLLQACAVSAFMRRRVRQAE